MPNQKKQKKINPKTSFTPTESFLYVNNQARKKYQFAKNLFNPRDNIFFSDFESLQQITNIINQKRDSNRFPHKTVRASQLNAFGLISQIFDHITELYLKQIAPEMMKQLDKSLQKYLGKKKFDSTLKYYFTVFHPALNLNEYSFQNTIKDILLLNIANQNPAVLPFKDLFEDTALKKQSDYKRILKKLKTLFIASPPFGPDNQDLLTMLFSPSKSSPRSLSGQLSFIYKKWKPLIKDYHSRILNALDLLKEEELKLTGPGKIPEYDISNQDWILEKENFSQDTFWMSRLVLIAKNTHVWLSQLSNKYGYPISKLDQIPDQELDKLADWGFTGLWLIGLWERSPASRQIKRYCGNPEAMASAYSIYDYQIAADLGGDSALQNLKERALNRNIRLSCDMVPNHMGIDSKWVIKKPDHFIYLEHSPFPAYSFNGPDLSSDPGVGIFLEDHYYNQTDAAVVFKRVDKKSGETRYIYHGNDGTSMPWNDSAQLNYLNPEVRNDIIRTIISVARLFPIIRFDAAMTLTRKHYQRLWFPEPGSGGDIPTRSLWGLSKQEFQKHMPTEFWKEVVDRISAEAPNTLLLAEAFWLMEAYFVRNLGMHRVYNSAFMNFLKNEQNAEFRDSLKNILRFEPEILKRLVNFMSNPDEDTAIAQFGKEDKYFCTCLLLITLPGLPLFNHGQIEGFEEKYGMEYKKPYYTETEDQGLVKRHQQEIFPLLKKRYLFAEVDNFFLYDLVSPNGTVDEDVIAFSNRLENESFLVVANNKHAPKSGWIKNLVPLSGKNKSNLKKAIIQSNLLQGLGFTPGNSRFIIFRDYFSGLEYIRKSREMHDKGLYINLEAYKYRLFSDFYQVLDTGTGIYSQLENYLDGQGVPDITAILQKKILNPLLVPFQNLFSRQSISTFQTLISTSEPKKNQLLEVIKENYLQLLQTLNNLFPNKQDPGKPADLMGKNLGYLFDILSLMTASKNIPSFKSPQSLSNLKTFLFSNPYHLPFIFIWFLMDHLHFFHLDKQKVQIEEFLDNWGLGQTLSEILLKLGAKEQERRKYLLLLKILIRYRSWFKSITGETKELWINNFFKNQPILRFIQANLHNNILWFQRESCEELFNWFYTTGFFSLVFKNRISPPYQNKSTRHLTGILECLLKMIPESKFQLSELQKMMKKKLIPGIKKKEFS